MLQSTPTTGAVNPLDLLMAGPKAHPAANTPAQPNPAPPAAEDASTALLEQLLKGTSLPALPAPTPAADATDVARALLTKLASSERVVSALAEELIAMGLVAKP